LQVRHRDLLRLDGRWEALLELDECDELAHLALMRRHAATGDRHAALRQFERLDRALRREFGVAPSAEASALRDELLTATDVAPARGDGLLGRDHEMTVADRALVAAAAGHGRALLVVGAPGAGKSAFVADLRARAAAMGFLTGHGTSARIEGEWPYAPVIEALADLCRRNPGVLDGLAEQHRLEIDRALAGADLTWSGGSAHQLLFVAAAELVRSAAVSNGVLLTVDDAHDADDASLRLIHYIARSTHDQRVCIAMTHRTSATPDSMPIALAETRRSLLDRHGAIEIELGAIGESEVEAIVRRYIANPSAELIEQITMLGEGLPFAVTELARGAARDPTSIRGLDAVLLSGLAPSTRAVLQRVAVVGVSFDTDEFVALSGLEEAEAFERLDDALVARIIEPANTGYGFRHAIVRDALLGELPPHRRRAVHRDAASRLIELGASPARIGHHLLHGSATADAVPYLLRAAETEAAVGAYRDALALVDAVRPHATGARRAQALALRADLLNAVGDPMALSAYREALEGADAAAARHLRVRLANCALTSGDLDTAAAALDGLDIDGGPDDADILLARGKSAFFLSDFDTAQHAVDEAQKLVLAGEHNWKVLDLVTLQGMLAHRSGSWFDRMRFELRRTREKPEIANAIFDGSLCAAEYVLYGPTPYAEVIDVARDLQATARRSGALRAAAFAALLIGEAALLSGDLALASVELTEAGELHHDLGSLAGEAHSLQRLAEVRLAEGDALAAMGLLQQALPLARASMIARHLLGRIFGTMILAASDVDEARALVDRAESTMGWEDNCPFCSVVLYVPAVHACVRAGDVQGAQRHLDTVDSYAFMWQGTSWEARIAEARAALADARGDRVLAEQLLRDAIEQFERAGEPLDVERCRRAVASL
jgi:hypothetical protein